MQLQGYGLGLGRHKLRRQNEARVEFGAFRGVRRVNRHQQIAFGLENHRWRCCSGGGRGRTASRGRLGGVLLTSSSARRHWRGKHVPDQRDVVAGLETVRVLRDVPGNPRLDGNGFSGGVSSDELGDPTVRSLGERFRLKSARVLVPRWLRNFSYSYPGLRPTLRSFGLLSPHPRYEV